MTETNLPTRVYPSAPVATDADYPSAVEHSCLRWAESRGLPTRSVLDVLQYDGILGCWCFVWSGMFLGVESDGHVHS